MTRWLPLLGAAALAAGCTLEEGAWFAELRAGLTAGYRPAADRDAGGRFQRLASGYEVALDRAALQVGVLDLIAAAAGSAAFDPAHPPPGYSLCHNGHCHADDGRLVPYATVAAGQGGQNSKDGGPEAVASLAGGGFDLLAPHALPLACPGGCRLGLTHIVRARASVTALQLEGLVRAGPGAPRPLAERPFSVEIPAPGGPPLWLDGPLDVPADNRHPPRVDLDVTIDLDATLFDHLDWASFPDPPGRQALAEALTHVSLLARLRR